MDSDWIKACGDAAANLPPQWGGPKIAKNYANALLELWWTDPRAAAEKYLDSSIGRELWVPATVLLEAGALPVREDAPEADPWFFELPGGTWLDARTFRTWVGSDILTVNALRGLGFSFQRIAKAMAPHLGEEVRFGRVAFSRARDCQEIEVPKEFRLAPGVEWVAISPEPDGSYRIWPFPGISDEGSIR